MRIYVAGKMRGVQFFNYPAFHEAEQHLKDLGHEVVSPARLDLEAGFMMSSLPDDHDWSEMPPGMDYEETMARDLSALDTCDAIYMLRGWHSSQGARREQIHAAATGRHEFFEQDVLEPPPIASVSPHIASYRLSIASVWAAAHRFASPQGHPPIQRLADVLPEGMCGGGAPV